MLRARYRDADSVRIASPLRADLIFGRDRGTSGSREFLRTSAWPRFQLSVWRYCEASAAYIFGGVVSGKAEDVIATALRQAGETGMTRTEIRDLFGRHRKRHEVDAALAALAASGKAKCIVGATTGGRPPTVWIELRNGASQGAAL